MMKFFGNGIVWDPEKNKRLCKFVGGEFETDDKRTADMLIKLKYKHEGKLTEPNPDGLDDKELDELKKIADEKGITYNPNIGKAKLLEKIRQGDGK